MIFVLIQEITLLHQESTGYLSTCCQWSLHNKYHVKDHSALAQSTAKCQWISILEWSSRNMILEYFIKVETS